MFLLTVLSGRPSKISARRRNDRFDFGFDLLHTKDKRKNLISWLNQQSLDITKAPRMTE